MFDLLPYPLTDSLLMFFIYSFIGWVIEVIYYGVTEGHFINRGFLNGPLCPVYGIGFYCALWFFEPLKSSVSVIFYGSAVCCTVVELIAGVILYQAFHLRWWDYTDYAMNFKGFICFRFGIYWDIAGSLGVYLLHPAVLRVVGWLNFPVKVTILSILGIIIVIDIIATVAGIIGFSNKLKLFTKISSTVKSTSDFIGGNIYGTVGTIMEMEGSIKDSYDEYRKLVEIHKAEENDLARRHREEEKEYFQKFLSSGKDAAIKTKDIAGGKMFGLVKSFNLVEKRLIRTVSAKSIKSGVSNAYGKALNVIRFGYFKNTANSNPVDMVPEDITLEEEQKVMSEDEDIVSV
ncbi:MAG: putative ABC transporter permease [Clostridiales bacterium]|nr:putative ABC transporter permease [Clostridiales bacterium]